MNRKIPNGSQYDLHKVEVEVSMDIEHITQQLARLESLDSLNEARAATAKTYRDMIATRLQLLEEIREQAKQFKEETQDAVG